MQSLSVPAREKVLWGKRILVIDDSLDNLDVISYQLRRAGAEVETAEDGPQGIEAALSSEYHLVLMDIHMPLMDGCTAACRLRRQGFSSPILAFTAHVEMRERCLESGCTEFLTKPVSYRTLIDCISNLV